MTKKNPIHEMSERCAEMAELARNLSANHENELRSRFIHAHVGLARISSVLYADAKRIDELGVSQQPTVKDSLVHALENLLEAYACPSPHDDRKSFIKAAKDAIKRAKEN
jgi:hypothetical protein